MTSTTEHETNGKKPAGRQRMAVEPHTLMPDREAERAILAERTDEGPVDLRYWTLGDLIVEALVGRLLVADQARYPDQWETIGEAVLATYAEEVAALAVAQTTGCSEEDTTFDEKDVGNALGRLANRMRASVELVRRLVESRYGQDPHFGMRGDESDDG